MSVQGNGRRLRSCLLGLLLGALVALSPASALAQSPDDEYELVVPTPGNEAPDPPPTPEPAPEPAPAPDPAPAPAPPPAPSAAPAPEVAAPEPTAAAAPVDRSPATEKRDGKRRKERRESATPLIPPELDNPAPSTFSTPEDRSLPTIVADALGRPIVAGLLLALAAISVISAVSVFRRRRPALGPVA